MIMIRITDVSLIPADWCPRRWDRSVRYGRPVVEAILETADGVVIPRLDGKVVTVVRPDGTFFRCTALCVESVHRVPALILTGVTVDQIPVGSEIRLPAAGFDSVDLTLLDAPAEWTPRGLSA